MHGKVTELLAEVLQVPAASINADMAMKDLEIWDSLKHMELIVGLEQAFEVEFTFDEIIAMKSVGEIQRVLEGRKVLS
ncbi:MAG: acyl carrier protein [Pyrinomonadaceae bacterium]|nr:acyl carrier protein [Pyrinomonadaceae bacterium]